MSKVKFYYCTVCGNIIEMVHDSGNNPICCMRDMEEIEPGVTDGNLEYHVPTYTRHGHKIKVQIGKEPHPMEDMHYIEWIELETTKGISRRYLKSGDKPTVRFRLCKDEEPLNIYAYCNKHKLWKCTYTPDDMEHQDECSREYDRYTCD